MREMKNLIIICLLSIFSTSVFAQNTVAENNAPIFKFEAKEVDYGVVERDSEGLKVYKFTNIGKSPLIISKVTGSCGCTVPSTPKEPIMPGASAEIQVKYDTHKTGKISKSITIFSNAQRPTIKISVRGFVKEESSLSILEKKEKSLSEN